MKEAPSVKFNKAIHSRYIINTVPFPSSECFRVVGKYSERKYKHLPSVERAFLLSYNVCMYVCVHVVFSCLIKIKVGKYQYPCKVL